ncbi:hypothetical protein D9V37_10550 [Nocardioides mangrovicus]|uniref:PsbP C-terminal domain-containing protein n=1 Tax=Nocardioides mangrovicus TaxID=2478913 RepID=A0A3L8P1I9_9ACTN|nr:hypothetical protein D9V37_10550 [Nocardioides mangrovicus]
MVLAGIAALAVVLAGYFGWLTLFRPAAKPVPPTTVVNTVGGYRLTVPEGMTATRRGKITSLVDASRSISVTVTTTAGGAPRSTNDAVVATLRRSYQSLTLLGSAARTVDRRPGRATYGAVVDAEGRRIQFVVITVKGRGRNYALSAFAPIGAKGVTAVRHRFDTVVEGFRVGTG